MDEELILVTGASGQQGGAVAEALLKRGQNVRVMSRNPDKLKKWVQMGAEAVAGDFEDPIALAKALEGVNRAFLVTSWMPGGPSIETKQGIAFVNACLEENIEHLVYSSVGCAEQETGVPVFDSKWQVEEYINERGIPSTILRPVFFMENFWHYFGQQIQQGKLHLPIEEDVAVQMVSLDVIGNFGAAALIQPHKFIDEAIGLATDELTMPEACELISEATGKPLRYEKITMEQSEKAMGPQLTDIWRWFNEMGYDYDLEELEPFEIPLTTFEEYLATAPWVRDLRLTAAK